MIKVLIADNDDEQIKTLSKFLTNEKNIEILDIAKNEISTLNSYILNKPDVLIINIKLNVQYLLEVLERLKINTNKCNVILTTVETTDSLPPISDRIYTLYTTPYDLYSLLFSIQQIYINNKKAKPNFETMCENILLKLGFNLFNVGTIYLIKTITLIIENNLYEENVCDIYKKIAIKENLPPQQVKWKINNSINSMYRVTNKKVLKETFDIYDGRKPTAKYIISLVIYKIKKDISIK